MTGRHRATLAADLPLEARRPEHALVGDWQDPRDCDVKPDFELISRRPDAATIQLVRIGSHAELGV
ncbi:type II toxin-antitoxin system mRNA interferase toxin, RelE/StbE family [Methylobacterium phyllostachyos]|uniref:type II toxin-antitoxin system mRNA interferase toxin, RelE/StbE family n=1 Tax=Methylobacterium phyllostachyos TaxID=582672 RepID=UPI001FCDB443|nr:type II toxin-antitoxin system mRNA interferase toxin, RelE/StbE family [Methylobacterium phyllostachyos]